MPMGLMKPACTFGMARGIPFFINKEGSALLSLSLSLCRKITIILDLLTLVWGLFHGPNEPYLYSALWLSIYFSSCNVTITN